MSDDPAPNAESRNPDSAPEISLPLGPAGEAVAPVSEVSAGGSAVAPNESVAAATGGAGRPRPAAETAPPPLAKPAPAADAIAHPIVFHGRADEYFRIWIVNTLLTLLTVGVFFSWAKVRKRRYLRGSTELLGHRFDYRADPVRLLIGHVVVLILFLGYSLFGVVYPVVRFSVLGLGIVLLPWIVVRSFTFNAHNTVYRGLRFRFNSSLSAAAKVYLLEPVLIVFSLGLYYPAWQRSRRSYAIGNHRFGDAYFHFDAGAGQFYAAYLAGGAVLLGAAFTGALIIGMLMAIRHAPANLAVMIPFFILYGFGFYLGRHLTFGLLFNHVWNHTRIDDHRFSANLEIGRWLALQLTNLGAIVVSFGLLYPWAAVRAQRYVASCLRFSPAGSIDRVERVGGAAGSATGDMAAEFIGIDFGL